jgi:hypothetical protein
MIQDYKALVANGYHYLPVGGMLLKPEPGQGKNGNKPKSPAMKMKADQPQGK